MLDFFAQLTLLPTILIFASAVVVIGSVGVRLAGLADRLADRTGIGEAVAGALFLGATTSLSGTVTSFTAAATNHPELAFANAVGGIAAQTVFLAIADFFYREANLEHAAASHENLLQGVLLAGLLSLPLIAMTSPAFTLWNVHPVSGVILIGYILGQKLVASARSDPMWRPNVTDETREDEPDAGRQKERLLTLWLKFALVAAIVGLAGWVVAQSGLNLTRQTGLTESLVGTLFTAVSTSLPELVTTISAVRRGALTLAVGGIIGGNAFDVLFLVGSDIFYQEGSLYHAVSQQQAFLLSVSILMTVVMLLGLLRREKHGVANIGFESALLLGIYSALLVVLIVAR